MGCVPWLLSSLATLLNKLDEQKASQDFLGDGGNSYNLTTDQYPISHKEMSFLAILFPSMQEQSANDKFDREKTLCICLGLPLLFVTQTDAYIESSLIPTIPRADVFKNILYGMRLRILWCMVILE